MQRLEPPPAHCYIYRLNQVMVNRNQLNAARWVVYSSHGRQFVCITLLLFASPTVGGAAREVKAGMAGSESCVGSLPPVSGEFMRCQIKRGREIEPVAEQEETRCV